MVARGVEEGREVSTVEVNARSPAMASLHTALPSTMTLHAAMGPAAADLGQPKLLATTTISQKTIYKTIGLF